MRVSDRVDRWLGWLTSASHNLRSFAVLRILYGIGLLITFVPSIPERSLLWGEASFWVDPEARRRGFITFDTLFSKSNPLLFDLAFFALILVVIVFILGYRTRIVTPILFVMVLALQSNNQYVLNGGDTLYRITLVFLLFANLSAHYSVDAWLAARRSRQTRKRKPVIAPHVTHAAHNLALVLCGFQIVVVYVVSGVWKLQGDEWMNGTALFYAMRIDAFMVYPMLNEALWQSSLLIYIATFIALWVQTLFPLALLWRPTRIFVLLSLVFMHSGIGLLLGLWPFSLVMIALDMLFIRDSTWVKVTAWVHSTGAWTYLAEKAAPLGAKLPRGAGARKRPVQAESRSEHAETASEQPEPAEVS